MDGRGAQGSTPHTVKDDMIRSLLMPFESMTRWTQRAKTVSLPEWPNYTLGQAISFLPDEGEIPYHKAFKLIPDIYACVTLIQERIGALPLRFYDADENEIERKPDNITGLWAAANARDTGLELVMNLVGSLDLYGNAYLFLDYMGTKQIREFWCLPAPNVTPIPGKRMNVSGYRYDPGDGTFMILPPEQIIHFRRYNPEPNLNLEGLSPLSAARIRYETQRDAARWLQQVYKRGGIVSGQYSTDQMLADQDIKRIQQQMAKRFGGPENAGLASILPRGLKYVRAGLTQSEMQFIETADLTSADIYKIFHIPPVVMGVKEGGGLSDAGASTDFLLFYENCLFPRCELITAVLNERLLGGGAFGDGTTCRFDYSGVLPLQEVFLSQANSYVTATGGPILTRAEARERLELKELDDPDEQERIEKLLIPSSVSVEGEPPAPATPPAPSGSASNAGEPHDAEGHGMTGMEAPPRAIGGSLKQRDGMSDSALRDRARIASARVFDVMERHATAEFKRLFKTWERRAVKRLTARLAGERVADGTWTATDSERAPVSVSLPGGGFIDLQDLMRIEGVDVALVRRLLRAIAEHAGTETINALAIDMAYNVKSVLMSRYITIRAQHVTNQIAQTTWKRMRDALANAVAAGGKDAELIGAVKQVFAQRSASDARMIARTETVAAYNRAQLDAWKQIEAQNPGSISHREWVTAQDERVRDGHAEAEGQRVRFDEPFKVRGSLDGPFEPLMYPGDEIGSPDNIINCRCVARVILNTKALTTPRTIPAAGGDDLDALLMPSTNGHAASVNGKRIDGLPPPVAERMGIPR